MFFLTRNDIIMLFDHVIASDVFYQFE